MISAVSIAIVVYAYVSALVFLIGTIYVLIKWIFNKKGPTNTFLGFPSLFTYPGQTSRAIAFKNILKRIFLFSSVEDDKFIRSTSLAFHWSLWIVIAAHLDIVLSPYVTGAGISKSTLELLGSYLGTSFAVVMVGSGTILLSRRIYDRYIRRISNVADYFSILLILAIGIAGIYMRIVLPSDFAYSYVTPFILSLVSFSPINVPMQAPFIIHLLLTTTLLIYFPFSKFMHPYSFFTNPTLHSSFHTGDTK